MFMKYRCWILIPCVLMATASCDGPKTATQVQMAKMGEVRQHAGACFVHMADNAILRDMSIVDHHFAGETAELSGTGAARLERMTPLLNTYGGIVRYETYCEDEKLIAQRIKHVREYLVLAGCNMERVEIKHMMSGGLGMPADDAIEIHEKGTVAESSEPSAGGLMIGMGQRSGS